MAPQREEVRVCQEEDLIWWERVREGFLEEVHHELKSEGRVGIRKSEAREKHLGSWEQRWRRLWGRSPHRTDTRPKWWSPEGGDLKAFEPA